MSKSCPLLVLKNETRVSSMTKRNGAQNDLRLHQSDTVRTLDVLSRILTTSQEDSSQDVCSVSVESSDTSSHGGTDQVLLDVDLDQTLDSGLQDGLDDLARNDSLSDNGLATTFDPVDGSGLLVGTVVTREGEDDHSGELELHASQSGLGTLGNHVHTHSVTGLGSESDVKSTSSHGNLYLAQLGETGCLLESLGNM